MRKKSSPKFNVKKHLNAFKHSQYLFLRTMITDKHTLPRNSNKEGGLFYQDEGATSDTNLMEDHMLSFGWRVSVLRKTVSEINGLFGKKDEFLTEIRKFSNFFNLGEEWILPLATLVLRGILCPPLFNLKITSGVSDEKGWVYLELGPNTSLSDIELAWPEIKARQSALWPNFKKTNFTKKSFEHLREYLKINDRSNLSEEEKNPNLNNYELLVFKAGQYNLLKTLRKESGEKTKSLKPKTKKTYREIAKEINPTKNNGREANRLAQLKRRLGPKI